MASSILMHMAAALVLGLATVAFYRVYLHPLAGIPGPRLAALSSCWYAYQARSGQLLSLGKTLHKKYGPVVRVAPNEVWFDSKEAFRIIYSEPSLMHFSAPACSLSRVTIAHFLFALSQILQAAMRSLTFTVRDVSTYNLFYLCHQTEKRRC